MVQATENVKADKESIEVPNSQVKIKKGHSHRRSFSSAQKLRFLEAFDACKDATERGAFLRKEGLYYASISDWRRMLAAGKLGNPGKSNASHAKLEQLTRENEQLKKKLSQANAILDLQKKVSELLGVHILPHSSNEVNS